MFCMFDAARASYLSPLLLFILNFSVFDADMINLELDVIVLSN